MKKLFQATKKPTPPFLKINYTGSGSIRHLLFDFMFTWGEIILSLKNCQTLLLGYYFSLSTDQLPCIRSPPVFVPEL